MLEEKEKTLNELKQQVELLKDKLKDLDIAKKKVADKLDNVIAERDLLSIQIIKRKEELKLLIEKIKIYNSILKKSEFQFNEKESKIQLLK